jgi:hypothetical protein
LKFLGTVTQEVKHSPEKPQRTSCDGVDDPSILTSQLCNTKKSFRYKKFNQVRISEIHSFCPREYALGFLTDTAAKSFVDFPLQQVFDLGTALHFWYQNYSKVFQDSLCGYWYCVACSTKKETKYRLNEDGSIYFGKRPSIYLKRPCEHCGASSNATFYSEYMFRLVSPYRVVGKLDGVLEKDGVYRFADFKSFDKKNDFPLSKDVAQLSAYAHFYQYIPEKDKLPVPIDTSISYLIYISKNFSYREPLLTYPVQPSKKAINKILERVSQFTNAAETGELPPPFETCVRSDWATGKAKNCSMRDFCKEKYNECRDN